MARVALVWAPQAVDDLEALCEYIARDSESYARAMAARVLQSVELIRMHPHAGRMLPEFESATLREVICGNYRVIYELVPDEVHVLTIHHGARALDERPHR